MDTTYLSNESEKFKFTSIEIRVEENIVKIQFLNDGFVTDTYIALSCYKNSDTPLKSIFIVSKDENSCIVKELIPSIRILGLSYKEFVDWLTNNLSYDAQSKSGDFSSKKIIGLELRYDRSFKKCFPSVIGCEITTQRIKWQILGS